MKYVIKDFGFELPDLTYTLQMNIEDMMVPKDRITKSIIPIIQKNPRKV